MAGGAGPFLRLATYNVEWFNGLFDDAGHLRADDAPSARYGISRARQIAALISVFQALDADGIMVIEAPDTGAKRSSTRALEQFAARAGLRARAAVTGYASDTDQEITFLYDPDRLTARHDPRGRVARGKHGARNAPRFDGVFRYDLDADGGSEVISFSKPPLELALRCGDVDLRLIGVHAKSKAPHGAETPDEFTRIAIDNRRKQLAQCLWLRGRIERHLAAGDPLIVMGDLNDGPGLDEYEKLFGKSGVEIVLGLDAPPSLRLFDPHAAAALSRKLAVPPATARFYIAPENRYFEALLDFIMVSHDLCHSAPRWRIWHPQHDGAVVGNAALAAAITDASDHYPVTLDLDLSRIERPHDALAPPADLPAASGAGPADRAGRGPRRRSP